MIGIRRYLVGAVSLALAGAGCGGGGTITWVESEVRADLQTHLELWEAHGFTQYSIEYRGGSAFSGPNASRWKTIHVADGAIQEAVFTDSGAVITADQYQDRQIVLQTVDQAFALIESSISQRPYKLTVTYNAEYGYPESISVDRIANAADDERLWSFTNLIPVD